jgi:Na+/proline symporter
LGGLILASFLCDAMQTLVSGVNSIAAIATKDVIERLRPEGVKAMDPLTMARVTTVGVGLVATVMAMLVARGAIESTLNIVDLMPRTFNMFLGPLAALFMIGMFIPRARGRTVIRAVALAMLLSFCWSWWSEIPQWLNAVGLSTLGRAWTSILGVDANKVPLRPTVMLAIAVPCVTGVFLGWLLSLFEPRGDHPGRQYTWWATMKRPLPSEN